MFSKVIQAEKETERERDRLALEHRAQGPSLQGSGSPKPLNLELFRVKSVGFSIQGLES